MNAVANDLLEVRGVIDRIIYQKDDFMIGKLKTDKEEITFRGNIFGVEKSEEIIFKGVWKNHPKYGKQLEVKGWERPIPKTKEKIIVFLASLKGCGNRHAARIVNTLGENAIEIIMREKEEALLRIKGIGKKRASTIAQSVIANYELQNIISELSEFGINPEFVVKLYKKYGSQTVDVLKENPYLLTEMKGISFPQADEIARRIGICPTSGYRIEACVKYILNSYCHALGHCFLYENELIEKVVQMLNQSTDELIEKDEVSLSIFNLDEKAIIIENGRVYPKELYVYETKLAQKIKYILLAKNKTPSKKKIEKYIKEYQLKHGIILGEEQKQAIKTVLLNNLTILTGSAGTGKTTVVKAIIEIYQKFYPKNSISLSAPTGRASRKLQETTGHFAQTNHRLLGYKKDPSDGKNDGFEYNEENKLPHDFFIIDEMSMVDLHMAYSLFCAFQRNAKVLLIGDVHQLPSISPGNILRDLIDTGIPKVRLTEIYRQAQKSQIIVNANKINQGQPIQVDHSKGDMYFISREKPEDIQQTIIDSVKRFLELGYNMSDILVLSPIKKGIIGTIELNNLLQDILNPKSEEKQEVKHGKRIFRLGDKIMQTVNRADKGIYNGDIGIITEIGKEIVVDETGEREVEYIKTDFQGLTTVHYKQEWNELELGYCISVHKSQGGQARL